jgi:hypothetical protein
MKRTLFWAALLALAVVSSAAAAGSGSNIIYDATTSPRVANVPSVGFEATSTKQFGDEVTFAGTNRKLKTVRIQLSSWACQSGHWYSGDCMTSHGATFSVPLTLNLYNPPSSGAGTGSLIASVTRNVTVRYRPSASKRCGDGRWFRTGQGCLNGYVTIVKLNLASENVTLPDTIVYGISYNTTHFGPSPIGEAAPCYTSSGGCPYDALNVGLGPAVRVGSKPHPDTVYWDTSYAPNYCDGGAAGVSTFRLDSPTSACWSGYVPAVQFTASKH